MTTGKQIRLNRLHYAGHTRGLIVPIDHGLTVGPVRGIENTAEILNWISHPAVCAVLAHKGMVERLANRNGLSQKAVILHVNGMSSLGNDPDRKERVTSLATAVRFGADAVSLQLNFDGANDAHNLRMLGSLVDAAERVGLPVLTMLYDKVETASRAQRAKRLKHLIRIAVELGTDALKLAPPAFLEDIPELIDSASKDVLIYFAGGTLQEEKDLLRLTKLAMTHGASGLCMGRNIFQRKDPSVFLDKLKQTIVATGRGAISYLPTTLLSHPTPASEELHGTL